MITRLGNGQGLSDPINGGVRGLEPGESKNDVLVSAAHDIEEMFLDNLFNVGIQSASIADYTSLVCSLVHILDCDGGSKFLSRKLMFSDKLPVNVGDICARVY